MNTASQHNDTERVSQSTETLMYGVPQFMTLIEAARATGLTLHELHARLEDGRLKRCRPVIVSSDDLREEIIAHKSAGIRDLLERALEVEDVNAAMAKLGLEEGPR